MIWGMTKVCIICGRDIHSKRADAKFCSGRCRVSHHRAVSRSKALPDEVTTVTRWVRHDASKRPLRACDGRSNGWQLQESWATYSEAQKSPYGTGIGFVLGGGVGCWDLDHCIVDGELLPWAREVITGIEAPLWVERSMSGDGVHIFVRADEGPALKIRDGRNIEFYSRDRFIAVTQDRMEV